MLLIALKFLSFLIFGRESVVHHCVPSVPGDMDEVVFVVSDFPVVVELSLHA